MYFPLTSFFSVPNSILTYPCLYNIKTKPKSICHKSTTSYGYRPLSLFFLTSKLFAPQSIVITTSVCPGCLWPTCFQVHLFFLSYMTSLLHWPLPLVSVQFRFPNFHPSFQLFLILPPSSPPLPVPSLFSALPPVLVISGLIYNFFSSHSRHSRWDILLNSSINK